MSKAFFLALAAFAFSAPAAAQPRAQAPADPVCPTGDRELPRGPEWTCRGRIADGYRFAFVSAKAIERVPALDEAVRGEADRAEAWIAAQAREQSGGQPLGYEALWQLDAALPEIAAASGSISHYTGGAHGGIEYKSVLIDRRRGEAIEFADLFETRPLESRDLGDRTTGILAVQASFCRALTAEVRERRGDAAAEIECPAIESQPVALVCGPNGRIDRFRALLNPYVAGAWAEGPYEVEFPLDAVMMEEMKGRYRPAFGLPGERRARIPALPCR